MRRMPTNLLYLIFGGSILIVIILVILTPYPVGASGSADWVQAIAALFAVTLSLFGPLVLVINDDGDL